MNVIQFENAYRSMLATCISEGEMGFRFKNFGMTGSGSWAPLVNSLTIVDVPRGHIPQVDSRPGHGIYKSLTTTVNWDRAAYFTLTPQSLTYAPRGAIEMYRHADYEGARYSVRPSRKLSKFRVERFEFIRNGLPHYEGTSRSVFQDASSIKIPWGYTVDCYGPNGGVVGFRPPTVRVPEPVQDTIPRLGDLRSVAPLVVEGERYTRNRENWNERISEVRISNHHSTGSLSYRELVVVRELLGGRESRVVARVNFLPVERTAAIAHGQDSMWLDINRDSAQLLPELVFTYDGPPSRTGYSMDNDISRSTHTETVNAMRDMLGSTSAHPFEIALDFQPLLSNDGAVERVPLSRSYRDFYNAHAFLMCTRAFTGASSVWLHLFRTSLVEYYSHLSCDILVRDRVGAEASFNGALPTERLYHFCVADSSANLFTPGDNICRTTEHAAELMRLTASWGVDSYESIIRRNCEQPVRRDDALVKADSVSRQVCGCFLPPSVVEVYRSSLAQVPTSNLECWYPPCQIGATIRPAERAECPGGNLYVNCSQTVQLDAGGAVKLGSMSAACTQIIDTNSLAIGNNGTGNNGTAEPAEFVGSTEFYIVLVCLLVVVLAALYYRSKVVR